MLDKTMLVEDGWRPFVRNAGGGKNGEQRVRVAKGGARLILSAALWVALGSPDAVRLLWDPARGRVALEPADAEDHNPYVVSKSGAASTRVISFVATARALDLSVPKATVVPHELRGFRLIVDLRSLRSADGADR